MKQRDIKKLPPEEVLDAWFAEAVALAKKYGVTAGFVVGVVHSPNVDRLLSYAHFGSGETDEWHRPFDIALVYATEIARNERENAAAQYDANGYWCDACSDDED